MALTKEQEQRRREMELKCVFCKRTTTEGLGEQSGFGRVKATISGKSIEIVSCPDHHDKSSAKFAEFLDKALKP